jgi:hypothetical protein
MRRLSRRENLDAKNAERCSVCRGRVWWARVQTPCGREIGRQKRGRSTQVDGTAPGCCHLRNGFSPTVEVFRRHAARWARSRLQHHTHGLNAWIIHGGVIVSHSRHRVRRLNAMALILRSRVAFTYESAEPGRSKNPGHHDRENCYRSCGSLHHSLKLYSKWTRCTNLVQRQPGLSGGGAIALSNRFHGS